EIDYLQGLGVARIFSPNDGQRLGPTEMINVILTETAAVRASRSVANAADAGGPNTDGANTDGAHGVDAAMADLGALPGGDVGALARTISRLENSAEQTGDSSASLTQLRDRLRSIAGAGNAVVLGVTGTGGSGESSLTDELIRRL